jgi:hypothetical protein
VTADLGVTGGIAARIGWLVTDNDSRGETLFWSIGAVNKGAAPDISEHPPRNRGESGSGTTLAAKIRIFLELFA